MNAETANSKSSFLERRRLDSAYSLHRPIRDQEVSGESGYRVRREKVMVHSGS
jgi:hypothetical protein